MADSLDEDEENDSPVDRILQDLTNAGKYSYASLCTSAMSTLFETETDR